MSMQPDPVRETAWVALSVLQVIDRTMLLADGPDWRHGHEPVLDTGELADDRRVRWHVGSRVYYVEDNRLLADCDVVIEEEPAWTFRRALRTDDGTAVDV